MIARDRVIGKIKPTTETRRHGELARIAMIADIARDRRNLTLLSGMGRLLKMVATNKAGSEKSGAKYKVIA